MPIPTLDDDGLLPLGTHDCTFEEVRERFGQYQTTDRRCRLFEAFAAYVNEVAKTGLVRAIIVDGSFVTGKPDPNDIDLILILPPGHEVSAELRPFEYNLLSRRKVRQRYGFDVLLAEDGQLELSEYINFFTQVRGVPGRRKGLVKVTI